MHDLSASLLREAEKAAHKTNFLDRLGTGNRTVGADVPGNDDPLCHFIRSLFQTYRAALYAAASRSISRAAASAASVTDSPALMRASSAARPS